MSGKTKARLIKYGCSIGFVVLFAWLYLTAQDYENATQMDRYRLLCDALSVPGVLLIMFGGLVWAANEGALLGVGYVIRFAIFSLIPGKRLERDEKYGDYVARKSEKKISGYGFLFFSGLASLTVGIVFLALFYTVY